MTSVTQCFKYMQWVMLMVGGAREYPSAPDTSVFIGWADIYLQSLSANGISRETLRFIFDGLKMSTDYYDS